jgi:hypothetical protein
MKLSLLLFGFEHDHADEYGNEREKSYAGKDRYENGIVLG